MRTSSHALSKLALPEVAGLVNRDKETARKQITTEEEDPFINACRALAKEHGLWIHVGSTPIVAPGDKFYNHQVLISGKDGTITDRYNKIHLFDVFVDGMPPTGESDRYAPGTEAVVTSSPWGPLGMSICYDMRFPALYRKYAKAGAGIMLIPSAFTVKTGVAHWETLLRARAIETGSFVIAAAQWGDHADGRTTYGHSLCVSPWGKVLMDLGEAEAQETIDLDLGEIEAVRRQIPSLKHDREYTFRCEAA